MAKKKPLRDPKSYDVGHRKPPVETRFKPGQSGNPRGRPKAVEDFEKMIGKFYFKLVPINENGVERKAPRVEFALLQLFKNTCQGKPSAVKKYFDIFFQYLEVMQPQGPKDLKSFFKGMSTEDLKTIVAILEKYSKPSASTIRPVGGLDRQQVGNLS